MKRYWVLGFFLAVLLSVDAWCETINWRTHSDGLAAAGREKKKIYLYFKSDRCPYCVKLDRLTFTDPGVISYLNTHFISIKINADHERRLAQKYQVAGYPDHRFLNVSSEQVFQFFGFYEPKAFMILMEYVRTDSYKTMDPMQFYQQKRKKIVMGFIDNQSYLVDRGLLQ